MKNISLRTKLVFAFIVLGLGPLILMGFLAIQVISLTHRQDVATMENQILTQKTGEINKFLDEISGLFDIRVGFKNETNISDSDQEFLLQEMLQSNKYITEVSFLDMNGMETSKLSNIQDTSVLPLSNLSSWEKFKVAKQGKVYFGPVNYTLRGPTMTIAGPVTNAESDVVMVITGEISLDPLIKSVSYANLGTAGYLYILDNTGLVVASGNRTIINKNTGHLEWAKSLILGNRMYGDIQEQVGIAGEPAFLAGLPLSKLGWSLVAEWPADDAMSVVQEIIFRVLTISEIAILVVLGLAWLVGRKILNPLTVLQAGAIKISSGHFDYKIKIKTGDELEKLGEVFNRMGDSLKMLEKLKEAEIREQALAESLLKEKELSHARAELLRNASHQLRTPMSIVRWNFELLEKEKDKKKQLQLEEDMGQGIGQLGNIISDLIVVSELGVNFQNTLPTKVNLKNIIDQAISKKQKVIEEKALKISINIAEGVGEIKGHMVYLPKVFEQLLENAMVYTTKSGKINIEVKKEAQTIVCKIADTGIGVPEKEQPLLFTQFFRATNAIDMRNVGTGLGLYMCKLIIEGHGGKINLHSELGKGTVVDFTLPI